MRGVSPERMVAAALGAGMLTGDTDARYVNGRLHGKAQVASCEELRLATTCPQKLLALFPRALGLQSDNIDTGDTFERARSNRGVAAFCKGAFPSREGRYCGSSTAWRERIEETTAPGAGLVVFSEPPYSYVVLDGRMGMDIR